MQFDFPLDSFQDVNNDYFGLLEQPLTSSSVTTQYSISSHVESEQEFTDFVVISTPANHDHLRSSIRESVTRISFDSGSLSKIDEELVVPTNLFLNQQLNQLLNQLVW